jgi:hypothetical protein
MNKCGLLLSVFVLLLSGCGVKDGRYYRSNLNELQKALNACPKPPLGTLSCQQVQELASHMHDLATQLQYNPQEFGIKIIQLQQGIVRDQLAIQNKGAPTDLKEQLREKEQDLADRLAVVKWLESPER